MTVNTLELEVSVFPFIVGEPEAVGHSEFAKLEVGKIPLDALDKLGDTALFVLPTRVGDEQVVARNFGAIKSEANGLFELEGSLRQKSAIFRKCLIVIS